MDIGPDGRVGSVIACRLQYDGLGRRRVGRNRHGLPPSRCRAVVYGRGGSLPRSHGRFERHAGIDRGLGLDFHSGSQPYGHPIVRVCGMGAVFRTTCQRGERHDRKNDSIHKCCVLMAFSGLAYKLSGRFRRRFRNRCPSPMILRWQSRRFLRRREGRA